METTPQIQTVIQEFGAPISTVVYAPWVSVTSVNGMTGDVIVEVKLSDFEPGKYYPKNTPIIYEGMMYYAKKDFTAGSTFNVNDWDFPQIEQVQANWKETSTSSKAFILNKPTKLSEFTNDLDLISEKDVDEIVKTRIDPLDTKITSINSSISSINTSINELKQADTALDTRITTVQGTVTNLNSTVGTLSTNVGSLSSSVTTLSGKVDDLSKKIDNMGFSGTYGSQSVPIYINNGQPTVCTTTATNRLNSVVVVGSDGLTKVSSTVDWSTGAQLGSVGNNLYANGDMYVGGKTTLSSRAATLQDSWIFVGSNRTTYNTSLQEPMYVYIPNDYAGDGWEYRFVLGGEFIPGSPMYAFLSLEGTSDGRFNANWSQIKNDNLTVTTMYGTGYSCAARFYLITSNDSYTAEGTVSRAGSGNFWNVTSTAGGISGGACGTVISSGRTIGSGPISFFDFRLEGSGTTTLTDSHITVWARNYKSW